MGDALQADHTAGDMGVWPSELDEQLISDLLTDDDTTLLEALQVPLDLEYCSRDTGAVAAPSCNSGGDRSIAADEHELLQPAAVSRALCSVYSGPTIRDVEKALTSWSYPCTWSNRRYSSTYLFRGVSRGAPESKYTTKVRSCAGKMPSDGFKWRKYGQKSIKNNPHVRSYYKCTSSRCGAKKHVEKSVDDPEMLVVTYEGSHLHGPQPLSPRRQWAVDLSSVAAAAKKAAKGPSPTTSAADADNGGGGGMEDGTPNQTTTRDAEARGVGTAGKPPVGRQGGRTVEDAVPRVETTDDSCDGSAASVAATWAADTVLPCDSPPTDNWPCWTFDYFPWSPEPLLLYMQK